MSSLIAFPLFTAAVWVWNMVFFIVLQKSLFALLNHKCTPHRPSAGEIWRVYAKGAVSDAIVASYLTAIPMILALTAVYAPGFPTLTATAIYGAAISVAVALITISDAVLYRYWNAKIDTSVFAYLRHPKGAFASVSTLYIIVASAAVLTVCTIYCAGLVSTAHLCLRTAPLHTDSFAARLLAPVEWLVMAALLFMVIRGLKIRPNNPSVVYFSPVPYLNHWALNPAYNLIYSLGTRNEFHGRYQSMSDSECLRTLSPYYPTSGIPEQKLLRTRRPDILIVVWESFGAEFCGALGGREGVTPCFDAMCADGVLFTHCRASSFRTDRALPAILCGLPGQPDTSIVRHTRKLPALPALPRLLRDSEGYDTMAVHGGDLTIMHKSDFYLSSGHTHVTAQSDLPAGLKKGKWGIHDAEVADWLTDRILERVDTSSPWLITLQTLSSHEPFTVPYARLRDPMDNSMAYTDEAIGRMMQRLKNSPVWDNLLVVIVADHGMNHPDVASDRDRYSRIPLLLAGGAVAAPAKIDTLMCQTDIPAILLGQMGITHTEFPFSRDIFAPTYTHPCAVHTYINGIFTEDTDGFTDRDNVSSAVTAGTDTPVRTQLSRAFLQALYQYIDRL